MSETGKNLRALAMVAAAFLAGEFIFSSISADVYMSRRVGRVKAPGLPNDCDVIRQGGEQIAFCFQDGEVWIAGLKTPRPAHGKPSVIRDCYVSTDKDGMVKVDECTVDGKRFTEPAAALPPE